MSDKEFVNGLIAKAPHEKAPDFVKVDISIKREELIEWLSGKQEDWININVKESKGGNWYAEVNDWKPEAKQEGGSQGSNDDMEDEDLPF